MHLKHGKTRLRWVLAAALLLGLPALAPADATTWIPAADLRLDTLPYLRTLADSLAARGFVDLAVEPVPGHAYRIDPALIGTDALFEAALLTPFALQPLGEDGLTLLHDIGLDEAGFARELDAAADSLEALLGVRPVSFAYPRHVHTRALMTRLRDSSWLCARDGAPHGTGGGEPTAGFLLGHHSSSAWRLNWNYWTPWELVLSTGLSELALAVADSPTEMDMLLHDSATYSALHSAPPENVVLYTYGYASLAEMWAAGRSWVQVYVHGASEDPYRLDATHLAWLMDALVADGRFWITDHRTAAARAAARHAPSAADSLVYVPLPEHANDPTPWNGYPCAFSFSTDDGRSINLAYADTLAARGLPMTAFITWDYLGWPGGDHLSRADLLALAAKGNVEIGSHSMSHPRLIPREALRLRATGGIPYGAAVTVDGDGRHLRLYREATTGTEAGPEPGLGLRCASDRLGAVELRYSLPQAANVQLDVLDPQGRRVRTLLAGPRPEGPASLTWDGRDPQGRRLAAGVYLIRLRAAGEEASAKAHLLR